ncbi:ABC transporter substrate-binding protein [Pasteurellaceae bacterium Orientalotternb1]|nr:ABC transporter substrate-binding protein [Pasteurellaceae bacterium Orientalotternb1]
MKKSLSLLFSLFSLTAIAHPHSFLDMRNKVLIENEQLQGFEMTWILDEITSSELIYEIQSNKNRKAAEAKITEELNQSAVDNHYFSELYDEKNTPIKFKSKPVQPSVEIKDNRLFYHFTLSLAQQQPVKGKSFRLFSFEPSYYLYMGYEKYSDLTSSKQNLCKVSLEEPKVNQQLRLYASSLDKTESPDMPSENSLSLGAQFAQKVKIECQ